jgi:DNA adenine methylase
MSPRLVLLCASPRPSVSQPPDLCDYGMKNHRLSNGLASEALRPVLRWAGGKHAIRAHLIRLLPSRWARYIEPMVGAGALFFSLRPKKAILADTNEDLINFYQVLRARCADFLAALAELRATKELYYRLRASRPIDPLDRAIRFIYLNRLCWNGLYRVNRSGEFNVPIGDRLPDQLWIPAQLRRASAMLGNARIHHADFATTLSMARPGDFVFLDPPYPRGSTDILGFNRYSSNVFTLEDHACLSECVQHLNSNGVKTMIALADTQTLDELYPAGMLRHRVASKSLISCDGTTRRQVGELILTSYRTQAQLKSR